MRKDPIVPLTESHPVLPADVLREGGHGKVVVEVTLDANGIVQAARVVESSDPRLNQAVLDDARRMRYRMPPWARRLKTFTIVEGVSY